MYSIFVAVGDICIARNKNLQQLRALPA